MTELLLLTIGHALSAVLLIALGFFVLFQNPRRLENILFFSLTFWTAFFNAYFAVGINLPPSDVSYRVWLLNVFDVFIMTSYIHFMLRAIKRDVAMRWFIIFSYAVAFVILIVTFFRPELFLPAVTGKMYLKSYLNAGPWYHVMLVFFLGLPLIAFFELVRAYVRGGLDRILSEYYIATSVVGYGLGTVSFYLVYNIPIDPFLGMGIGLYTIPIAYGIVSKQLLDIRVAVKRAFFYALGISVAAGALTALLLLNNLLVAHFPSLQIWVVPLTASVAAVVLGRAYFVQAEENDRLKYEFITIAMHKLRTPLTRIRWQVAALSDSGVDPKIQEALDHIDAANNQLITLTDTLVQASESDSYFGLNKETSFSLPEVLQEESDRLKALINEKKLRFTTHIADNIPLVTADRHRIASVVGVILENACVYTSAGGSVSVSLENKNRNIVCTVEDTGIGISADDQKRIFSRFFRTEAAKHADTEGMGLGLAMSKAIISHYRGDIGAHSEGEGKGSTFWFSIPL